MKKHAVLLVLHSVLFGAASYASSGPRSETVPSAQQEVGYEEESGPGAIGDSRRTVLDLLGKKPSFKVSVLGERRYVLMLNDRAAIGRFVQIVSRGSKKDGASYVVTSRMDMNVGPMTFQMDEQAWLNVDASVRKLRQVEKEPPLHPATGPKLMEVSKSRGMTGWTFTKLSDVGDSWEASVEQELKHWGEVSSIQTFLRIADLSRPGEYLLDEVLWSDDGAALKAGSIRLIIGETSQVTHHDTSIEAVEVQVHAATETSTIVVSELGEILSIEPKLGQPLRLLACEQAQCERLLEPPALDGPTAAAIVFFECIAGHRDKQELDDVMSWEHIAEHKRRGGEEVSAEELRENLLGSVSDLSVFDAELIKVLPLLLEASIEGERATVGVPGRAAIQMGLFDGRWKVVESPL